MVQLVGTARFPRALQVDNAEIGPDAEMIGTGSAAEQIEPGVGDTDVGTEPGAAGIETNGTEAECVAKMVIVAGTGSAPGFAAVIFAASAAPSVASVGAQVVAVPFFVDSASAVQPFVVLNVLASPAAVALLAFSVPMPSAVAVAVRVAAAPCVVAPTAAAESAFAAPTSAVVRVFVGGTVAVEFGAAVADVSAEATAAVTGAVLALVVAGS